MTAVWSLLQERVYSRLTHRPAFLIDLVDPSSRSESDIRAMLETLPGFETGGSLTLGLNGNEANILAGILKLPEAGENPAAALLLAEAPAPSNWHFRSGDSSNQMGRSSGSRLQREHYGFLL